MSELKFWQGIQDAIADLPKKKKKLKLMTIKATQEEITEMKLLAEKYTGGNVSALIRQAIRIIAEARDRVT